MSGRFPALGFDPAPGDPDAVVRTAARLRGVADELGRQAGVLRRSAALTSTWQGSAACAYAGQLGVCTAELLAAAEVLGTAACQLLRYAGDLRDLQARALRLERAAVPLSTAVCLPGPATELEAVRAQARRLQEQAEHAAHFASQEVRRAAQRSPAARRFDGMTDAPLGIPVGPWAAEHQEALGVVGDRASWAGAAVAVAGGVAVTLGAPVLVPTALLTAAAGGAALLAHGSAAHYGDGAVGDVVLDVAGLGALGVGVKAGRLGLAALAKASDRVGHGISGWTLGGGAVGRLPVPGTRSPRTPPARARQAPRSPGLEGLLVRG